MTESVIFGRAMELAQAETGEDRDEEYDENFHFTENGYTFKKNHVKPLKVRGGKDTRTRDSANPQEVIDAGKNKFHGIAQVIREKSNKFENNVESNVKQFDRDHEITSTGQAVVGGAMDSVHEAATLDHNRSAVREGEKEATQHLRDAKENTVDKVDSTFTNVVNATKNIFSHETNSNSSKSGDSAVEAARDRSKGAAQTMTDKAKRTGDHIESSVKNFDERHEVTETGQGVVDGAIETLRNVMPTGRNKESGTDMKEHMQAKKEEASDKADNFLSNFVDSVKGFFSSNTPDKSVDDEAKEAGKATKEKAQGVTQSIVDTARNAEGKVESNIKQFDRNHGITKSGQKLVGGGIDTIVESVTMDHNRNAVRKAEEDATQYLRETDKKHLDKFGETQGSRKVRQFTENVTGKTVEQMKNLENSTEATKESARESWHSTLNKADDSWDAAKENARSARERVRNVGQSAVDKTEDTWDSVKGTWRSVTSTAKDAADNTRGMFRGEMTEDDDGPNETMLSRKFRSLTETISGVAVDGAESMQDGSEEAIDNVDDAWKSTKNKADNARKEAAEHSDNVYSEAKSAMKDSWGSVKGTAVDAKEDAGDISKGKLTKDDGPKETMLSRRFRDMTETVTSPVVESAETAQNKSQEAADKAKSSWFSAKNKAEDVKDKASSSMKSSSTSSTSSPGESSSWFSASRDTAQDVKEKGTDKAENAWYSVKNTAKDTKEEASDKTESFFDSIFGKSSKK